MLTLKPSPEEHPQVTLTGDDCFDVRVRKKTPPGTWAGQREVTDSGDTADEQRLAKGKR